MKNSGGGAPGISDNGVSWAVSVWFPVFHVESWALVEASTADPVSGNLLSVPGTGGAEGILLISEKSVFEESKITPVSKKNLFVTRWNRFIFNTDSPDELVFEESKLIVENEISTWSSLDTLKSKQESAVVVKQKAQSKINKEVELLPWAMIETKRKW